MMENHCNGAPENAYLNAPEVIVRPGPLYSADTRKFQGIPSLACTRKGKLFAVWYGGITPDEDHNNYVILSESSDAGNTWPGESLVIDPDGEGPVRAFDPEVWLAPNGRLWVFWAQHHADNRFGSLSGVWTVTTDSPDSPGPSWSQPRRLTDGVMMCKPLVLSSGEWCLPVSLWHKREAGSAALFVSRDEGLSWHQRGACNVPPEARTFDEHMVVERLDGSLWMLVRTLYGIGESASSDSGHTWSPLAPSGMPHPCSRFFIRRLKSGRLLLVRNNPADGNFASIGVWGTRSHLTAYISADDGKTWHGGLLLDERDGVSYPDGEQSDDGTIHIIYDFDRRGAREILMAIFSEEDVIGGAARSGESRFRVLVNKASG